jgi:3-phytase
VTHLALGPRFPGGLLVTQDEENTPEALDPDGEERDNSNFKFTRWEDVAAAFEPPLEVRPR